MATAQQLLAIEAKEIGYSRWNDPEQGTKYGRWYADLVKQPWFGTNGVAFCAMGQSWSFAQASMNAKNVGIPTAGCGDIRNAAIKAKKVVNRRDAKPGDLVLFRWDGKIDNTDYSDHVGMVELNRGDAGIQTIEFNTNNGQVMRRARGWNVVQFIIRPDYDGTATTTKPASTGTAAKPAASKPASNAIDVDGYWGPATTRRLQQVLGVKYVDGIISGQNPAAKSLHGGCSGWEYLNKCSGSKTIAEMQRRMGITADGLCGKNTINALIKRYSSSSGAECDGKISAPSITVKAMQKALNNGKF